jgi:hypothetical protein
MDLIKGKEYWYIVGLYKEKIIYNGPSHHGHHSVYFIEQGKYRLITWYDIDKHMSEIEEENFLFLDDEINLGEDYSEYDFLDDDYLGEDYSEYNFLDDDYLNDDDLDDDEIESNDFE